MNYEKKVVLVTGGSNGIGRCIAKTYSKLGASVIIADIDEKRGKDLASQLISKGGIATFVATDISNPKEIKSLMEKIKELYGTLHILINNAGISRFNSPYQLEVEEWDQVINTNLRGTFLCSREAARLMRETNGGAIINIASTRATMSEPNSEAYAASKGGIVSLTHALASSFTEDHIRVNCISPGWIHTGEYEDLRDQDHDQHFSKRVGIPEDIAKACLFLSDKGNEFINGTEIVIDGGMTKKMIYKK